jgi:hypothetical protein
MIAPRSRLELRLAELVMTQLAPCDLGDGIEVVHDVESLEIELDCDLSDAALDAPDDIDLRTHQFVRFSAPYERIELQIDDNAFLRATIEEARDLLRSRSSRRHYVSSAPADHGASIAQIVVDEPSGSCADDSNAIVEPSGDQLGAPS